MDDQLSSLTKKKKCYDELLFIGSIFMFELGEYEYISVILEFNEEKNQKRIPSCVTRKMLDHRCRLVTRVKHNKPIKTVNFLETSICGA